MSVMKNFRRLIPVAALAVAAPLALSACGDSASAKTTEDGRLKVTASFYPTQFLVEQIGRDHVQVSTLTKPGTEPHDLELSPRQTGELADTGMIIYLKGIQPAVDDAIKESGVKDAVDIAKFTTLEKTGTTEDGHAHEEEHAEEEGHDHGDEHGLDPHIWIDPVRYAQTAKGVGEAMAKADPDHAADYRRNAADLADRLGKLDKSFAGGLKNRTTDTFITTHAAFGYLADRYGLVQESIKGLDPESEPSAKRMRELHEIAEHDDVTTVFFETLVSPKTAETLAGDLGLRTAVLDPIEGISDTSPGSDYFQVQEANLKTLQKALGAK
ncbi:metal ABC transporter substrate-binding protein [Streptomyces polyrhachis]|uniref:Metal ABC transporter substrate-binding protein n=1 Tax=Streptomyces polyrhachis TaxID=1282885 RepID=A0ABW2GHC1_9ACTN